MGERAYENWKKSNISLLYRISLLVSIQLYYNPILSLCTVLDVYLDRRPPSKGKGWHPGCRQSPRCAGRGYVEVGGWGGNKAHSHRVCPQHGSLKLIHASCKPDTNSVYGVRGESGTFAVKTFFFPLKRAVQVKVNIFD